MTEAQKRILIIAVIVVAAAALFAILYATGATDGIHNA